MKVDYTIKICDICKRRITNDINEYATEPKYGKITLFKRKSDTDPYGYPYSFNEPITFTDICEYCRADISEYVMKNLYKGEMPKFEVKYSDEVIESENK